MLNAANKIIVRRNRKEGNLLEGYVFLSSLKNFSSALIDK